MGRLRIIALTWLFRDENNILDLIYEKQICPDSYMEHFFYSDLKNAYHFSDPFGLEYPFCR